MTLNTDAARAVQKIRQFETNIVSFFFVFSSAYDNPETGRLNYQAGKPTSMRYQCLMRL